MTEFLEGSNRPMCPFQLESSSTRQAPENPSYWARCTKSSGGCVLNDYNSNQQIFDEIVQLSREYPALAKPFTIGFSSEGLDLVGLRISRDVRREREMLKPMIRLVGNIHGNEVVGREILLHLARYLLQAYEWVGTKILLYRYQHFDECHFRMTESVF